MKKCNIFRYQKCNLRDQKCNIKLVFRQIQRYTYAMNGHEYKKGDYVAVSNPESDYASRLGEAGKVDCVVLALKFPVYVQLIGRTDPEAFKHAELRPALPHEILEAKLLGL